MKKSMKYLSGLVVIVGVFAATTLVAQWTGPNSNAPSNNIATPIHVGANTQVVDGTLSLGGAAQGSGINDLVVNGNAFTNTVFVTETANAQISGVVLVGGDADVYGETRVRGDIKNDNPDNVQYVPIAHNDVGLKPVCTNSNGVLIGCPGEAVAPTVPTYVILTASPEQLGSGGGDTMLTWYVSGVENCTAQTYVSGANTWSGAKASIGINNEDVSITDTSTFEISCTTISDGSLLEDTATVTVQPDPVFTYNPSFNVTSTYTGGSELESNCSQTNYSFDINLGPTDPSHTWVVTYDVDTLSGNNEVNNQVISNINTFAQTLQRHGCDETYTYTFTATNQTTGDTLTDTLNIIVEDLEGYFIQNDLDVASPDGMSVAQACFFYDPVWEGTEGNQTVLLTDSPACTPYQGGGGSDPIEPDNPGVKAPFGLENQVGSDPE